MRKALRVLVLVAWISLSGCATTGAARYLPQEEEGWWDRNKPTLAVVTGALVGFLAWHVYSHNDQR